MFPKIASGVVKPFFARRGRAINQRLASDMFRYEIQWGLANVGIVRLGNPLPKTNNPNQN